jgi:tyrosine-protein kinase Etk/Wzc
MRNENFSGALDRYAEVSANIDFKRLLRVLWSRWYWIVVALTLAMLGCFLFLRFSTPRYTASVTLRYNQKKTQIEELNKLIQPEGAGTDEYLTEQYVIESEEVIKTAIDKLNNPFTFYRQHTFRKEDVYPFLPFTGKITSYDPSVFEHGMFKIEPNGQITYTNEDETVENKFDVNKDTLIVVKGLSFRINSIKSLEDDYLFRYNDLDAIKKAVDDKISVDEAEQNLPILDVSFSYYNRPFTQDFLDKLIESYREYNLAQKKKSSKLTIDFINDQISIWSNSVKQASSSVSEYKTRLGVSSLQTSMVEVSNRMAELEKDKNLLEIQKSYIGVIKQSLSNRFEPINIGTIGLDQTTDKVLVELINELNKALLQRKDKIMKRFNINSEEIKNIDSETERLREQILSNIRVQEEKNNNTIQLLTNNVNEIKGKLNNLPRVERDLIYLQNDNEVKNKIYLLLLNRKIEASITEAGILPSFDVITHTEAYKVYPQALQVLLICLILGLSVGIGSVFLSRFINNTFSDVAKIGQNENVNLIGIINRYPNKVENNESDINRFLDNRSLFAESINSIRTNLSYLTHNEPAAKKGKLLVVTSEISGEGKSFVTVNLAISLTKINKRVLIIVSDLRRSKLHKFFNNNNKQGLSNYLSGKTNDYKTVIHKGGVDRLDFIPAGPVPYNPTELIQNNRFEQMIDDCLANYDYVIIDTAPIGLVSDNVLLLQKSDLVIFIIRWLYSSQEAHLLPDQVTQEYNLKKVGVIVNDFYKDDLYASLAPASYYASRGYGYSYKYSYEYYGKTNSYYADEEKTNLWQKLTKQIKSLFKKRD